MPLLILPNELLHLIASNLQHPRDLHSLILTSRRLAILVTPLLHKHALDPRDGISALHWAVRHGHEPLVQLILDTTPPDCRDDNQRTPLHYAAYYGHEVIILLLLAHGADIHARDDHEDTPLHSAVLGRQVAAIKLLIDCGADMNAWGMCGYTPLDRALQGGKEISMVVLKLLLDRGAKGSMHREDMYSTATGRYLR